MGTAIVLLCTLKTCFLGADRDSGGSFNHREGPGVCEHCGDNHAVLFPWHSSVRQEARQDSWLRTGTQCMNVTERKLELKGRFPRAQSVPSLSSVLHFVPLGEGHGMCQSLGARKRRCC